jgi:hypothetical protein
MRMRTIPYQRRHCHGANGVRPCTARFRAAALLAIFLLLFLGACGARVTPPTETPRPVAAPALDFDRLFQRTGDGWTGGDGTLSVLLPDGRTVWLFGDSLLGAVAPDNTRAADTPFIRNCLVVQDGTTLQTRHQWAGDTAGAFFAPPSAQEWFWPGDGTVEENRLYLFLHRFELEAPALWRWRWTGTALATLTLPALQWIDTTAAPSENGILYGACILETEEYTYIYGTQDRHHPKQAHLARAPAGHIQGPWAFYDGREWRDAPGASAPILTGVSTQYGVIQACNRFYLFSMDGRVPFSNLIVAYRSRAPTGPWQGPQIVYRAPETDPHIVAYNPFVHTQFSTRGHLLVSYNLNHIIDPAALYRDATIYRPRFIRVDLAELERRFRTLSE